MGDTNRYCAVVVSALEKVFPDSGVCFRPECARLTALQGDSVSFQVAFRGDNLRLTRATAAVVSPLGGLVTLRSVELVPNTLPCHPDTDEDYLRKEPGLYPDLLAPLEEGRVYFATGQWRAVWIEAEIPVGFPAGEYPIEVRFNGVDGALLCSARAQLQVYGVALGRQRLIHTEWFHADCLADYYHVEAFGPEHWRIVERFIALAVKRGVNMILTPIHTPPLDTLVGGERTTVQLVEVYEEDGGYRFGFDKLDRWVDLCLSLGVEYFEMAHLFTQWGARFAPKIVAAGGDGPRRIFGWDSPAVGGAYSAFLGAYLPALTQWLRQKGILERCYFHISDEPSLEHLDAYQTAAALVAPYLQEVKVIDALSNYDFYSRGIVRRPVPAIDHIQPFLDAGVAGLWTYYCTGQHIGVTNRFMAMPSARTRALGVQLYRHGIEGFLQWGYNFYNAQYSISPIDPYRTTDAMFAFPGGDAFLVYPGADGSPLDSIRSMVVHQAMGDLRALQQLEELTDAGAVRKLMEEELSEPISFTVYPRTDQYYLRLRNRVNARIAGLSPA